MGEKFSPELEAELSERRAKSDAEEGAGDSAESSPLEKLKNLNIVTEQQRELAEEKKQERIEIAKVAKLFEKIGKIAEMQVRFESALVKIESMPSETLQDIRDKILTVEAIKNAIRILLKELAGGTDALTQEEIEAHVLEEIFDDLEINSRYRGLPSR